MSNNQQPTGIVGNTASQASAATAARVVNMKQKSTLYITIGLVLAIVGIGVVLANANLSFAWKMVVAIAMIVGCSKLAKASVPLIAKWAGIIKASGWIVLIVTLLMSGFGQMTLGAVDTLEKGAATVNITSIGCPDLVEASKSELPTLTLTVGCKQVVRTKGGLKPQFQAPSPDFKGALTKYVDIRWVSHNSVTLEPIEEKWPIPLTESVTVDVMHETEGDEALLDAALN
jgi:hypothetical protein